MRPIRESAVICLNEGNDLLKEHPLKGGKVPVALAREALHAIRHDDEEGDALAACKQVIQEVGQLAHVHPFVFVFCQPVLEVEDGILPALPVLRRQIDAKPLPCAAHAGEEHLAHDLPVRHVLEEDHFAFGIGEFDEVYLPEGTVVRGHLGMEVEHVIDVEAHVLRAGKAALIRQSGLKKAAIVLFHVELHVREGGQADARAVHARGIKPEEHAAVLPDDGAGWHLLALPEIADALRIGRVERAGLLGEGAVM